MLLYDGSDVFHVIGFASLKSKPDVRSIMAAKLYAFTDAFGAIATLNIDLDNDLAGRYP